MLEYENVNFENLFYDEEDEKPYDDELDVDCKYGDVEGPPKSALRTTALSSALRDKCVGFTLSTSSVLELRSLDKWNDGEMSASAAMEEDDTEGEPDEFAMPLAPPPDNGPLAEKNLQLTQEVESLRATLETYKSAQHEGLRQRHALQEKMNNMEEIMKLAKEGVGPPLSPLALMGRRPPLTPTPVKVPPPPPPIPSPSSASLQSESRIRLEQANVNLDRAGLVLERVRLTQDKQAQQAKLDEERASLQAQQTALEANTLQAAAERAELTRLQELFQNEKVVFEQEKATFQEQRAATEQEKAVIERERETLERERDTWQSEKEAQTARIREGKNGGLGKSSTDLTQKASVDHDLEGLKPQLPNKALRRRRWRCWAVCFSILICVAIIVGGIKWAESAGMRIGPSLT